MKAYEKAQLVAIERWKKETPGFLSQAFDLLTAPIAWLAAQVIPDELARTAIMGFDSVARRMINIDDFLEYEKISSLEDLRTKDLRLSDSLAEGVHNRAIGMAGASGAALGATGIGGIPVDISALITLSLKAIHGIGLCYGNDNVDKQLVLGILTLSSTVSAEDRQATIDHLHDLESMVAVEVVEDKIKDKVISGIARGGLFFTARGVAKRLGQNFARRKVAQMVPVLGGTVGMATNAWFINDVCWASRRLFQEMWLMDNGVLPVTAGTPKRGEQDSATAGQAYSP